MDILKVLSRGTKQPPRTGNSVSTINKIPSAGKGSNPQLFNDEVRSSRGTKRKRRTQDEPAEDISVDDLSDLDYFAPKDHAKSTQITDPTQGPVPEKRSPSKKAEPLDEEECRQILRSHRLKLTVLPTRRDDRSKIKKGRKKKAAAKVDTKEDMQHLYPQPLTAFSELRDTYGISPRLAANLERLHYKIPTEVQMGSLPLLLSPELAFGNSADTTILGSVAEGLDFVAAAPTGSGKTLSFLIPAINGILKRRAEEKQQEAHVLDALVVAPTRELAKQIADEGKKLAVGTGVRVVAMKKGMGIATSDGTTGDDDIQFESEEETDSEMEAEGLQPDGGEQRPSSVSVTKADILVTTPMLLLNFLTGGSSKAKKTIPTARSLILDEADVLLDPLFRDQTLGLWVACTNPQLSVTFWSATMGSNIETMVTDQLAAHRRLHGLPPRPLVRLVVGLKDTAVPNITHKLIYTATEPGKLLALRQLILHPAPQARASTTSSGDVSLRPPLLVFTQTIPRATALHAELKYDIPPAAGGPARVAVLHAGLPDAARADVVRRFRAGLIWVLVTTDVLARGVDFAGVNAVVNYDVPASAAAYVHRAGRTGRAGRAGGVAVTLYTKDDIPFVKSVANVIAASERQAAGSAAGSTAGAGGGVQKWLLDALPDVKKADRKRLKERGVESRRSGGRAKITSKSAWERRRENNRKGAIAGSKRRKMAEEGGHPESGDEAGGEWGGLED